MNKTCKKEGNEKLKQNNGPQQPSSFSIGFIVIEIAKPVFIHISCGSAQGLLICLN